MSLGSDSPNCVVVASNGAHDLAHHGDGACEQALLGRELTEPDRDQQIDALQLAWGLEAADDKVVKSS